MNDTDVSIIQSGRRLKWLRQHFGLSQGQFAEAIGAQQSRYSHWETGKIRIPVENALRLVAVYSVNLDFLYMGKVDALPSHLRSAWMQSGRDSSSS